MIASSTAVLVLKRIIVEGLTFTLRRDIIQALMYYTCL